MPWPRARNLLAACSAEEACLFAAADIDYIKARENAKPQLLT
jgi:hypothetical protein